MKTPSVLIGALVCSLIGGAVAGLLLIKSGGPSGSYNVVNPHDPLEPRVKFICEFDAVTVIPAKRAAFFDAIKTGNGKPAVFRHNMLIYEPLTPGAIPVCQRDQNTKDDGLVGTELSDPCKVIINMGQQVTQRVGFNSRENLRAALKLIETP